MPPKTNSEGGAVDENFTEESIPKDDPGVVADTRTFRRQVVADRYEEELKRLSTGQDKVFYDGENLSGLDPDFITLDSNAGENPRNWSANKKWTTTTLVGFYCFLPPFASTIFAPSIFLMMSDIGITDPTIGALQISIFLFAFAIGPLFLAPLSEAHGRTIILHIGNVMFCAFSIGSGFAQTDVQLSICRFLAGIGGSAAHGVFGGVLGDIWGLKERAKASGIITTGIILGPVLGPACGGWMSERASWRWTCWVPAITAAVLEVVALWFLKESYIPTLLRQKLKRSKTSSSHANLYTVLDLGLASVVVGGDWYQLTQAVRPVIYLFADPVLFLLGFYYAFVFGELYLIIVTFSEVFGKGYGHSAGIIGIDLLSEGIGNLIGLILTVMMLNAVYRHQTEPGRTYNPESRLLTAFPGALLLAGGLFMYGFSALRTHFMVPLIGIAIFALGAMNIFLAIQVYIIDCFEFPASAVAAVSTFRCLFAGAFPLFGARLFHALGIDWGVGLLGFISLGLGVPFLPLIYVFGKRLREVGSRNLSKL